LSVISGYSILRYLVVCLGFLSPAPTYIAVVAIITNHLFPGLLEGDSDVFQSRPPGINVNQPPLRVASFSGLLLLKNESLVLEQPEGNRDNTGDHRVIVDDNQLFALVKLFEVGKGP